jgi:hypothetical protein
MIKRLTDSQVKRFAVEGILYPVPVLNPQEVAHYRTQILQFENAFAGKLPARLTGETHLHFPWAYELATQPHVLDVAEDLLGPDLLIHSTTMFHKPAGSGSYASWHQDGYFMELSEPNFITIWIALTPSNTSNGCVRVLPGTHLLSKIDHSKSAISSTNLLGSGLQVNQDFDLSTARDVVLSPGELSVHHVYTVHGSEPNHSDQDRIGFVVKLLPARVKQKFPHFEVVKARGEDRFGHWKHLKQPPMGDFEECLKKHIAFCDELQKTRGALGRKEG